MVQMMADAQVYLGAAGVTVLEALAAGEWRWVRVDDLEQYPLSMTGRKLSRLLLAEQAATPTWPCVTVVHLCG
jgi:hypothetical protein